MKCKHCDGTGTSNWCVNGIFQTCAYCNGTGKITESCLTCEAGGFVNEGEPGEAFCYLDKGEYIKDAVKKAKACRYYRFDGSDTGE